MKITYVLLSPTFGMHQYTADLANRATSAGNRGPAVHLVTTTTLPRDRYGPTVTVHTPVTTHGTGFSREGLDFPAYRRVAATLKEIAASDTQHPPLHFTGVHLWNVPLLHMLRRGGAQVIHTLHDLEPHHGVRHGPLIRLWNRLVIGSGCHLLVHGRRYRDQLLSAGVSSGRITCTPLLHGFLGAAYAWPPPKAVESPPGAPAGARQPREFHRPPPVVMLFGRFEEYKGLGVLVDAWRRMQGAQGQAPQAAGCPGARLVLAGPRARGLVLPPLPPGVEVYEGRVGDAAADRLFRSASLLVLPYLDATQSALIASAYAYGLPVIVTEAGALPEYVVEGETGWIVPPGDPGALAAALAAALADPARLARMGEAGRAWFAARRAEETSTLARMYEGM